MSVQAPTISVYRVSSILYKTSVSSCDVLPDSHSIFGSKACDRVSLEILLSSRNSEKPYPSVDIRASRYTPAVASLVYLIIIMSLPSTIAFFGATGGCANTCLTHCLQNGYHCTACTYQFNPAFPISKTNRNILEPLLWSRLFTTIAN